MYDNQFNALLLKFKKKKIKNIPQFLDVWMMTHISLTPVAKAAVAAATLQQYKNKQKHIFIVYRYFKQNIKL